MSDSVPSEAECLVRLHKSTMTQEVRKELVRVLTVIFPGQASQSLSLADAALMTDRQLHLTWLRTCEYIGKEAYEREFKACVGDPLFEDGHWVIPHPGTLQPVVCASFEEAMNRWFEGFNIPVRVIKGVKEPFSDAIKRVDDHLKKKHSGLDLFYRPPGA